MDSFRLRLLFEGKEIKPIQENFKKKLLVHSIWNDDDDDVDDGDSDGLISTTR